MAKVAYILLCHKDPQAVIDQANRLTAAGDYMAVHFDGRANADDYARIRAALDTNPNVVFAARRIKCGWGEWSLVQATLAALEVAEATFPRATHFYMLSGDCMPIKSAEYIHGFLDREDVDHIESFDFFASDWIKTGLKQERLIYRHFFNERAHKRLFYASVNAQKRLGLARAIPDDLQIQIGSQWWCLRRSTVEAVFDFIRQRRDVMRFFRTTWIPDETFFQTLVRHLIPEPEIRARTLTFLMFSDYGMPVSFYNDSYDLLLAQDFLFARKISPEAHDLKQRLGALYVAQGVDFRISNEGRRLYAFLTSRGREGRRFAARFWETESSLGRDRELLIILSKKWHVAKRFVAAIKAHTDIPAVDYLFDEAACALPDLGGIQTSLSKRTRHRRALMRMLFESYGTDRMIICLDPSNIDLLHDFYADRSRTRLLDIDCSFSDDYLRGHARRIGLAGEATPPDALDRLLPTIRRELNFERDRIRDANFAHVYRMYERLAPEENARPLADFLDISNDTALTLARTDPLFAD